MVNRSIAVLLATAALFVLPGEAQAQCTGQPPGNSVCASPNGAAGLPAFRKLVTGDLPLGIVQSVFGRSGIVIAQPNDYTFAQLSGSLALTQMPSIATNAVYGNLGSGAQATPVPSCAAGANALTWTAGTGFVCSAISFPAAPVTTVFGRSGAVVAASADYTFAQIGGTLATAQLPAGVAGTVAPTNTVALGTAAILSATCATVVTVAAVGVLATDVLEASFNSDPTTVPGYQPLVTGMLTIIPFPTAGNVNFKVCNNTAATITPGAITLNWRVTR